MRFFLPARRNANHIAAAITELETIRDELKKLPPSAVIWDYENMDKKPPWGDNISSSITDMGNYYVTNDGKDMIEQFFLAFKDAEKEHVPITIR